VTRLANSLRAWNTDAFAGTLRAEIIGLGAGVLPLQEATSGGCVAVGDIEVTVLGCATSETEITANVGVFFAETIGGCSCGDEPATSNAYCELQVRIDRSTGLARFAVVHR